MAITSEVRTSIFNTLSKALRKCSPPMVSTSDDKKIIPGMYFASVAQRKDSVTFYFFPIYYQADQFKKVAPGLIKCLKGKTCFHFKKQEEVNEKELEALLKLGVKAWNTEGYLL